MTATIKTKAPAFMLYVRDILASPTIQQMTGDEVKAYLFLLCTAWLETPRATLPTDPQKLANIARVSGDKWDRIADGVLRAFRLGTFDRNGNPEHLGLDPSQAVSVGKSVNPESNLRLYSERLLQESMKQTRNKANGMKGGNPILKQHDGVPVVDSVNPDPNPDDNHSFSISISYQNPIKGGTEMDLRSMVEDVSGSYPKEMVEAFLSYWTEKSPKGKKQRWQMEKTFDPKRRLDSWAKNDRKWARSSPGTRNVRDSYDRVAEQL